MIGKTEIRSQFAPLTTATLLLTMLRSSAPIPVAPSSPQGHISRRQIRHVVDQGRGSHWAADVGSATITLALQGAAPSIVSMVQVDNKASASISLSISGHASGGQWHEVKQVDRLPRDRPVKIQLGHLPVRRLRLRCTGHPPDGTPSLYSVQVWGTSSEEIRRDYGPSLHGLLVERTEKLLYKRMDLDNPMGEEVPAMGPVSPYSPRHPRFRPTPGEVAATGAPSGSPVRSRRGSDGSSGPPRTPKTPFPGDSDDGFEVNELGTGTVIKERRSPPRRTPFSPTRRLVLSQ